MEKLNKENVVEFLKKNKEIFGLCGLLIVCYCLYFFSMGSYPLIDVDETRYVAMSKSMFHSGDLLTLYLNGDFFFEKPPLYFWLETLSFSVFKHVNEMTARIPVALSATFGVFLAYFAGKKISSKKYGMISALILATCFEFIVLGRIAILDMLLAVCIAASTFAGLFTLFCRENYRKYFWWLAYIMAGFAVMAKGVPGVAIPALTIFFSYLIARRWKELFNPLYIVPGVIMFLIVCLPWHVVMLKMHGHEFYREYIYKHHFERFANSHELGRKQPFLYFVPVFFIGFLPWAFSFVSQMIAYFKKSCKNTVQYFSKFNDLQPLAQFLVLNVVFFLIVFLFYSAASTKLPTYILPAFFPASLILGKFWFDYIFKDENERAINLSTLVMNFVFIISAIGLFIAPIFIRDVDDPGMIAMQIPGVILIMTFVVVNIFSIFKDKKVLHFLSIISFMALLSMFATKFIFPYVVSFQQDELVEYSKRAKAKNEKLVSWGFGKRYSMLYYGGSDVEFLENSDPSQLSIEPDTFVIVTNKKCDEFSKYYDFETLKTGHKYSLLTNLVKKE